MPKLPWELASHFANTRSPTTGSGFARGESCCARDTWPSARDRFIGDRRDATPAGRSRFAPTSDDADAAAFDASLFASVVCLLSRRLPS